MLKNKLYTGTTCSISTLYIYLTVKTGVQYTTQVGILYLIYKI